MTTQPANGWALKILIGVATLLWAALLTFVGTVASNQSAIQLDMAAMKVSITNIEASISTITRARETEAAEATRMNRQRIQQLEGREQAQDQRPGQ